MSTDEPQVPVAGAVDRRTMRRAPRFGRFILLGVLLGAVASWLFSGIPPSELAISRGQALARGDLFWLLFLTLGLAGGVLGAIVAVLLDRLSLRRLDKRMRELG